MKYEFDKIICRRFSNSVKWDVGKNELPMWIADMDFETLPDIKEEIIKKASIGAYGYTTLNEDYFSSYLSWWNNRYNASFQKEWMIYVSGVIACISSAVRRFTKPNENVVVLTPVYDVFYNSIVNNGCRVLESKLVYQNGKYELDWVDLEEKLKNEQTSLMIFCNPHNPIGKIWEKEEIAKIGHLCKEYGVLVISDEIHCDLTTPGKKYIPFASVNEECRDNSITCLSPSKTFNLAGLQSACAVVSNKFIRHKLWRSVNTDEVGEPNFFSVEANILAYTKGGLWVDELNQYIYENKLLVKDFLNTNLKKLKIVSLDATYLLWIDISAYNTSSTSLCKYIRDVTGLYLNDGSRYLGNGNNFIRMNIATPRSNVVDGLNRLKKALEEFEKNVN